jgi:hypothetical protein
MTLRSDLLRKHTPAGSTALRAARAEQSSATGVAACAPHRGGQTATGASGDRLILARIAGPSPSKRVRKSLVDRSGYGPWERRPSPSIQPHRRANGRKPGGADVDPFSVSVGR